ncbi:rcc01693 family protein [Brucella haematophila]|uniref:Phage tail assembly chaperone n=1 Tax=Brucella haematophila TaxID=419474 RepID=A0ABX1DQH2_9HYPH|nr:rcc01693 family protein [Brucella haematophila]NKC03065.1 phage tail assembly chaperone [Brucella haematophila]TMV01512.1 phage tail assembly chaperone [Brucella haematophila]
MRAAVESESSPKPFPWDEVMRAGFGLLRLSSQAFWSMTPRELAAALGPIAPQRDAPTRHALDALMRTFPDG